MSSAPRAGRRRPGPATPPLRPDTATLPPPLRPRPSAFRPRPSAATLPLLLTLLVGLAAAQEPRLQLWYGETQEVGAGGRPQADFNLLGRLQPPELALRYRLDGGPARTLTVGAGTFGDGLRLARRGDFNADIPLDSLRVGPNIVTLEVCAESGVVLRQEVTVTLREAEPPALPLTIRWAEVEELQAVGQAVDGHWRIRDGELEVVESGYDRIFLIGDQGWQDYEVRTSFRVLEVADRTNRKGFPGLGLLMRFAGHVVGGFRNWPEAQPKWGFLPFGHLGWVRWRVAAEQGRVNLESFRGDGTARPQGIADCTPGARYGLAMRCATEPDGPGGQGVTRYSYKLWPLDEEEPPGWSWEVVQVSEHALRSGGIGLLAHFCRAAFGDVEVRPLP